MGRRKGSKNKPKITENTENFDTPKEFTYITKKDDEIDESISGYLVEISYNNKINRKIFKTKSLAKKYAELELKSIGKNISNDKNYKPKPSDRIFSADIFSLVKSTTTEINVVLDNVSSFTVFENNGKYCVENNLTERLNIISKY